MLSLRLRPGQVEQLGGRRGHFGDGQLSAVRRAHADGRQRPDGHRVRPVPQGRRVPRRQLRVSGHAARRVVAGGTGGRQQRRARHPQRPQAGRQRPGRHRLNAPVRTVPRHRLTAAVFVAVAAVTSAAAARRRGPLPLRLLDVVVPVSLVWVFCRSGTNAAAANVCWKTEHVLNDILFDDVLTLSLPHYSL